MDHTKEPWTKGRRTEAGYAVGAPRSRDLNIGVFYEEADRDRAVECVTACKGIKNPEEVIKQLEQKTILLTSLLNRAHGCVGYISITSEGKTAEKFDRLFKEIKEALFALGKGE